jgi:hypothetical protein
MIVFNLDDSRKGGVMEEDLNSAVRFRQRAEELRAIAEATIDLTSKNALLGIAQDYDRMALSRERIVETDRRTKSSTSH